MITKCCALPPDYEVFVDDLLSNITFTDHGIRKVVRGIDSNRARGHHMMYILMLKICEDLI